MWRHVRENVKKLTAMIIYIILPGLGNVLRNILYKKVKDPEGPLPDIIAGMRLTPESHGNAAGAGLLDLITRQFYDAIVSLFLKNPLICCLMKRMNTSVCSKMIKRVIY